MPRIAKDKEEIIDIKDKKVAKKNNTKDKTSKSSTSANKITSKNNKIKTTSSTRKKKIDTSRVALGDDPYKY